MNDLISIAFNYIGKTDRIMLNTGNGIAIVYTGSPEDAMLMAMDMRKEVLSANIEYSASLSICIGIHLESISTFNDINGKTNIIGNGIDTAKRIMSHAKPNEILVSRAYYENAPPSTQQMSAMFNGSCLKHENHVLEYQAYLVNFNKKLTHHINQPKSLEPLILTENVVIYENTGFLNTIKWNYVAVSLLSLIGLFMAVKLINTPAEPVTHNRTVQNSPEKSFKSETLNNFAKSDMILKDDLNDKDDTVIQEKEPYTTLELGKDTNLDKKDINIPKDSVNLKPEKKKTNLAKKDSKTSRNKINSTPEKNKKEIISWKTLRDSIRQGHKNKCTQLEITLKQCH